MPDLGPLTDDQRAALKEFQGAVALYRMAVERRKEAERQEIDARIRLDDLTYKIAGAT